jgi:hypothetical protein
LLPLSSGLAPAKKRPHSELEDKLTGTTPNEQHLDVPALANCQNDAEADEHEDDGLGREPEDEDSSL